jgi:hypothetical protein
MRHARDVLVTALILTLLGIGAGYAWAAVAPPARYVTGAEGARLADPATQNLIAADGLFAVSTAGAGLGCGILAFAFARRTAVLVGLALGGVAAALVAVRIGSSAGSAVVRAAAPGAAPEGSRLELTAQGVLLAWPLLAVAAFGLLETLSAYLGSEYRHRQRQALAIADLSGPAIVSPRRGVSREGRAAGRHAGRHARTRERGPAPPDPPRGGRPPGHRRADPGP